MAGKGRLENENRIFNMIEKRLSVMPPYMKDWYNSMRASDITAATCKTYITHVYNFLVFINEDVNKVDISKITKKQVEEYIISIKTIRKHGETIETSYSHRNNVWYALRHFMDNMVDNNYMKKNFMNSIPKPKNRDAARVDAKRVLLTEDEFKLILKASESPLVTKKEFNHVMYKAMLLIFMTTGIRKTALLSINLEDIDFENSQLEVIDKGHLTHNYILTSATIEAINAWLPYRNELNKSNSNALFISNHGTRISEQVVKDCVQKSCEVALGKEYTAHKLRAGFCSILYNKTGDIEFVRRAVGHSSSTITQRYIVTGGQEKAKAANLLSGLT